MNSRKPRSHSRMSATGTSIQKPFVHGVDDHDLLLDRHRAVLRLLEDLDRARAAIELRFVAASRSDANGANASSSRILREIEPQSAGDRLHRLDLRRATDARYRDADVHRGTNAGVEQVRLEEDLSVGDRDDVRRDVRRHVAGLRLDDRQRGQRTAGLRMFLPSTTVDLRSASRRARAGGSADRTRRPGYASRPGGRRSTSDIWRYAAACLDKSSYTHSVGLPSLYMKYSAIAQPE